MQVFVYLGEYLQHGFKVDLKSATGFVQGSAYDDVFLYFRAAGIGSSWVWRE
jgi:hypothetical protein